jgi:hypothetical protein
MTTETAYKPQVTVTKKAGKGTTHGVVSEVTAFVHVKPGKAAELDAALKRFHERFRRAPLGAVQKFGVHDMRHVIFDNGTRMAWIVAFDTDWDPYVDDAVALLGLDNWLDFLQYIEEYSPEAAQSSKGIKDFLQSGQEPASGFSRAFPNLTIGQIKKGQELTAAFEQVLEQPGALEALQNPALKPLLDMASA